MSSTYLLVKGPVYPKKKPAYACFYDVDTTFRHNDQVIITFLEIMGNSPGDGSYWVNFLRPVIFTFFESYLLLYLLNIPFIFDGCLRSFVAYLLSYWWLGLLTARTYYMGDVGVFV